MLFFKEFCKTQSIQNTHETAPYLKFFLGGGASTQTTPPPPPPADACNYNIIIST